MLQDAIIRIVTTQVITGRLATVIIRLDCAVCQAFFDVIPRSDYPLCRKAQHHLYLFAQCSHVLLAI